MTPLIEGLGDAFVGFGGVPHGLLFDQMKGVITRGLRLEGGTLVRNAESSGDLARQRAIVRPRAAEMRDESSAGGGEDRMAAAIWAGVPPPNAGARVAAS